jgi:hypothetical protein
MTSVVFADVEKLLVAWSRVTFPTIRACVELPATMPDLLIQFFRVAGIDPVPSLDKPTVDIDCYASTREAATALALQVRSAMRSVLIGYTSNGATVARVQGDGGPGWRPYANTNVRRVGFTDRITLHNHQ